MAEQRGQTTIRARALHHVRRRRGVRKIHPDPEARRAARCGKIARHRHARTRRLAGRRDHPASGAVGHGQAARARRGDAAVCRGPRRPCPHGDPAGARPGHLGVVRPLLRFDAGLSGQAGAGLARRAQRHAAGHHRRSQAGPDRHPRRARRDRPAARRRPARQRRARPVRGRGHQIPSGFARRLPADRRRRPAALRADRRRRRSRYGRRRGSGPRCAIICLHSGEPASSA